MSDLVGNHIVGFPTRRLKCLSKQNSSRCYAVFCAVTLCSVLSHLGLYCNFVSTTCIVQSLFKPLAFFCGCIGQFVSDLVANPEKCVTAKFCIPSTTYIMFLWAVSLLKTIDADMFYFTVDLLAESILISNNAKSFSSFKS